MLQNRLHTDDLPRTHRRGSTAIDHVWISSSLSNSIHKCGFSPFDYIENSDHRGIYIDLHIDEILDANMYSLQYSKNTRLKATIPKRVEKYLKLVEKKWNDQNIEKRFDTVRLLSYTDDRCKFEIEINKLDQSTSEILRHAEKKCTSLPTSNLLQWSPALKNAQRMQIITSQNAIRPPWSDD